LSIHVKLHAMIYIFFVAHNIYKIYYDFIYLSSVSYLSLCYLNISENRNSLQNSMISQHSSQPEIITVPERIVTVSARTSVSTDVSTSDSGSGELVHEVRVPPRLPARFQLLSKVGLLSSVFQALQ